MVQYAPFVLANIDKILDSQALAAKLAFAKRVFALRRLKCGRK